MIALSLFKNRKIALFGLGGSGMVCAQALIASGAEVIACDDNQSNMERAAANGIATMDLREADWQQFDALVLAPGVPLTHPTPHWSVDLAKAHNVEIIGDVEIFARARNDYLKRHGLDNRACPFIAITGTNGKSTTTALITYLLQQSGYDVQMGGNIGRAVLSLDDFRPDRFYVVECSSYQIDLAPTLNPTAGILLNLTPDHIDRHGTFDHYAAIKQRLVAKSDTAIIALDDAKTCDIAKTLQAEGQNLVTVATEVSSDQQADYWSQKTKLYHHQHLLADLEGAIGLRGRHNAQNALAALAACDSVGAKIADLSQKLHDFTGLAHRMQQIRALDNVIFVNDSKATNAEASAPALAAFDTIYWIAGGVAKAGGIASLEGYFDKIIKAYLIGEAAEDFAKTLEGKIDYTLSHNLEQAVRDAYDDARKSDGAGVVLLSPACASFDQFSNYEKRGEAFCQLVERL